MGIFKQKKKLCLRLNPYLLHFGNIEERHGRSFLKKNISYSLMTPYTDNLLIILTKFYPELTSVSPAIYHMTKITRDHQREISRGESHYFRKLGNWISVICGKIMTCLRTFGSVISEKMVQNLILYFCWIFYQIKQISRFSDFPGFMDRGKF